MLSGVPPAVPTDGAIALLLDEGVLRAIGPDWWIWPAAPGSTIVVAAYLVGAAVLVGGRWQMYGCIPGLTSGC
jgi:hypothetical protein